MGRLRVCAGPCNAATGEVARGWVNVTQPAMGIAQELNTLKKTSVQFKEQTG